MVAGVVKVRVGAGVGTGVGMCVGSGMGAMVVTGMGVEANTPGSGSGKDMLTWPLPLNSLCTL